MFRRPLCKATAVLISAFALATSARSENRAIVPADRLAEPWWAERHTALLESIRSHPDSELLLIGDSITNNYDKTKLPDENFQPTWKQFYEPRKALNLGFSGDTTANVLWRLDHGEVEGLHPKVALVLIGTNNTGHDHETAEQTEGGIDAVVADLERRLPDTRILLLGILPSDISNQKTKYDESVNQYLATCYVGNPQVTYLDIGSIFYQGGSLNSAIFYDPRLPQHGKPLHPDTIGQRRMAEAIEPTLAKLMQDSPQVPLASMTDINTALIPVEKLEVDSYDWYARHQAELAIEKRIKPRVVMIGDSITNFWSGEPLSNRASGPVSWQRVFGDMPVINMGFGWDRTQNVLWRMRQGEFEGVSPEWVVINIGTNNLTNTKNSRASTPEEIVDGILAICHQLHKRSPASHILLMAIFPRGAKADSPQRAPIQATNLLLSQRISGDASITYLDIGKEFLAPDGSLPADIMPDGTHPSEAGYQNLGGRADKGRSQAMTRTIWLLLLACSLVGQINETPFWKAHWVDVPGASPHGYGVYHFRKTFDLTAKPQSFIVDVSGDNRYQLYVNGQQVSFGPARGDVTHWRYEIVDIAPRLVAGRNVLAAVVWNDGPYSAIAQVTNQTGFLLHAEAAENAQVNTGSSWKCALNPAYSPQPLPEDEKTGYYALGANEKLDAAQYPWGWETAGFDDSSWHSAHEISQATPRFARDSPNRWMLVPREIPLEEQSPERLQQVRRTDGVSADDRFLKGTSPLTVGVNKTATILIDQGYLTTAFPELVLNGGAGATITMRYAEALFTRTDAHTVVKGNRNDIAGKLFLGPADTYLSDGGKARLYRPLFWRTYRYIQLEIKTAADPLTIEDLRGTFTGYPFQQKAQFHLPDSAGETEAQQILTTGFRTARLCSHETYMDCPFYEQLQYAGDARIQMMVSIYNTGDTRLMKNGISLLNSSRTPEGATYSRAPSQLQQYIPPFSLWWIGMVHDYWMYAADPAFVKQMLTGVRSILDFYAGYQKPNGSLEHMPWWNFVDWVKQWPGGDPPAEPDGSSAAALDLQLLLAYQWAADLESHLGSKALSAEYIEAADKLKQTVLASDWDEAHGLFADQPSHKTYSQHVNTLAVLAHITTRDQGAAIMQKVFADATLAQSSIYFRAYTNAALREVGLGDRYLETLGPWREMLSQGLTTWAEWNGSDTRSDCHAWGASPNFELLRTVAGIESIAPGFERVRISPNLGKLKHVTASMPHPKGEISVDLRRAGEKGLIADVNLPPGISGELVFGGLYRSLIAGPNHLKLEFK